MHISKLSLVNYRNFRNTKLVFNKGINTIIGENGSGKTNIFRALRLLLDENMRRSAVRLEQGDFCRALGEWRGHWIIISIEFDEISADESVQSLFLHGTADVSGASIERATYNLIFRPKAEIRAALSRTEDGDHDALDGIRQAITIADYEPVITGRSSADFNDDAVYKALVGDFETAVPSRELENPILGARVPAGFSIFQEICFTYIQALRDVVAEFHNNRTNPLLTLLKSKSGAIDPAALVPITTMVRELNASIESLQDVRTLQSDIADTIRGTAGETYSPAALSIKSDLSNDADKLFQSLKLYVGEADDGHEGGINDLSLGGANLIFLTLKLLEFKYQQTKQSFANFLIIEEPEAHIHTHIQKTLFDKLNFANTQIIYSTHSTQISEVSNVRNMNILGRQSPVCEAYQPSTGLTDGQINVTQRYLDAVRSNLLFAKSVILIEGDAEEILIPILVKKVLGISLDELGISLINIRSTGFQNVAVLFHDDRIRKRCAVVTDLDTAIIDTTPNVRDSDEIKKLKAKCLASQQSGIRRKFALETFAQGNSWIGLTFAHHTFEVDFIAAGNAAKVVSVLGEVYADAATIVGARTQLESQDVTQYGRRALTIAENKGKGWFALLLSRMIDYRTTIPDYILDAIFFAKPLLTDRVWVNILSYRVEKIVQNQQLTAAEINAYKETIDDFSYGLIDFVQLRNQTLAAFPSDVINPIMDRF